MIFQHIKNKCNLKIKKMGLMKTCIFLFALLSIKSIQSQIVKIPYEKYGFSANWYEAKNKSNKTIIIFGGSEGGSSFGDKWSSTFNEKGYNVLAMAYFGEGDLPKQLELIPLEYLNLAIKWLDSINKGSKYNYGLIGISKGAELSLIQASRLDRFKFVIALAPSSVVWQGINKQNYLSNKSSWTLNGQPLPYVTYCYKKGFQNIFLFYDCALDSFDKIAEIQVTNIKAPLLLISGGQDKLWPSERMSKMITNTLKKNSHPYEFIHLNYPKAGHWLYILSEPKDEKTFLEKYQKNFESVGGEPEEFFNISRQVILEMYKFIKKHF